ncbi:acetylornithine deacetylase [Bacteroidetes bacterium SCGC AAA795-G10]|nr:acetylornithine deacetylase [Bacteroidetes bacterium SCGC AAA795-G10]
MKKLIFTLLITSFGFCQSSKDLEMWAKNATNKSFDMFYEILSIPNDANRLDDIELNVKWCEKNFAERGFVTKRISTPKAPLLLAERTFPKAKETVLIYLQIDGQPVDNSRWFQESPYIPVLKRQNSKGVWEIIDWDKIKNYEDDWRIFARSTSDAKGPVVMFLNAMDVLEEKKLSPNFNIKVIMDFEEELGSPNLPRAVNANREILSADHLIIFDGPKHRSGKPTLTFGARGISTIQLTIYGPVTAQHSGHFGNYVPNPALRMAKLLASMKDDEGVVVIPGFYDGISIDSKTKKILDNFPHDQEQFMRTLQIGELDKVGDTYQESIQFPSLNIRGMQSGWIDEKVRTIIPAWARAEIDIRLVLESDPKRLISLVKKHVENQGYYVVDREPTAKERTDHPKVATFTHKISYQSFRTDLDTKVGKWLRKSIKKGFDIDPIRIRMSGGSIPISPFVNTLDIPAVTVPTVNRDNNQHSPNENIRLGDYRNGIKTILSILTEPL